MRGRTLVRIGWGIAMLSVLVLPLLMVSDATFHAWFGSAWLVVGIVGGSLWAWGDLRIVRRMQ